MNFRRALIKALSDMQIYSKSKIAKLGWFLIQFLDSSIRCKIWSSTKFIKQKLGDYLIKKIIALWKNAIFHSNTQAVFGVSNYFERYCMLYQSNCEPPNGTLNITLIQRNCIPWDNPILVSSHKLTPMGTLRRPELPKGGLYNGNLYNIKPYPPPI